MVRVKRGNIARTRRKKVLKRAKGFKGSQSKLFRIANQRVMKSLIYAYVGRKRKKRDFRKLSICRVNATARKYSEISIFLKLLKLLSAHQYSHSLITYSKVRHYLKKHKIDLNVKMLAQIAMLDIITFIYIIWRYVELPLVDESLSK